MRVRKKERERHKEREKRRSERKGESKIVRKLHPSGGQFENYRRVF